MNKKQLLFLLFINLSIASSFYIKNIGVGYSQLSSDLHNIIPMCMKFDNPDLYKNDLYLDTPNNFKYYTPFFVQTVRFFGNLLNGNYVKGLNSLLFFTHLLFGVSWFLLFYRVLKSQFWVSLLISILIRGIVWLPGYELWGISDLWTLMPRTFYAAFLPIPFILLFSNIKNKIFIASFLVGFIFNFHPISGLGGVLIFIVLLLLNRNYKLNLIKFLTLISVIFLGMLPFVITYFSKTEAIIDYNLELYEKAFDSRIPSYFQEPVVYINKWIAFKSLFYLMPLIGLVVLSFFKNKKYFKISIALLAVSIVVFLLPVISIPVENWFNRLFESNLRMSFQLVRIQKFVIIPAYFAMGFLLLIIIERFKLVKKTFPVLTISFLVLIMFSSLKLFNSVPFFSDDIARSIFPPFKEIFKPINERKDDFDKMAFYIIENTPKNAVFYNSYMLRSASKRSVKFDSKGASILIEGNPKGLIEWNQSLQKLKKMNDIEQTIFLKDNGVNYMLLKNKSIKNLKLIKHIGSYKLYEI